MYSTHARTHVQTCTHVHTHTHTYSHTHKHTHMHACTHKTHTTTYDSVTYKLTIGLHPSTLRRQGRWTKTPRDGTWTCVSECAVYKKKKEKVRVRERRKTSMQVHNGFKTYTHSHTLTCKHKDLHKQIHAHANTHTHMHTNTQDAKGVQTSTAFLYTHTCHYCIASDGGTCFCLPLQCYIIMYHHMHACLYVCCQWMLQWCWKRIAHNWTKHTDCITPVAEHEYSLNLKWCNSDVCTHSLAGQPLPFHIHYHYTMSTVHGL